MKSSTFKMPSSAQIQAWKKEHNEIHKITPDPLRPEIFCIVRHPKMTDVLLAYSLAGNDDFEGGKIQLQNCWLDGDESIKTHFELLKSASIKMSSVFRTYKTKVDYLPITAELLKEIPADKHDRVNADGEIRKLTVIVEDKEYSALVAMPGLVDTEKANTASNMIDKGTIYLQECWLSGDEDLKSGSDEIRFAAYLAALTLLRNFIAKVEKL